VPGAVHHANRAAGDGSTKGCDLSGRTPWRVSWLVSDGGHGALDP